jgi:hypothetical protein
MELNRIISAGKAMQMRDLTSQPKELGSHTRAWADRLSVFREMHHGALFKLQKALTRTKAKQNR